VVKATGARFGLHMLSAVNAQSHLRFMTLEGTVNATVFRELLQLLITDVGRKILLVVDGHPAHKGLLLKTLQVKPRRLVVHALQQDH
jgi:hypothetical protein